MSSRKAREKLRLRRIAHDKLVEESRKIAKSSEEKPAPEKDSKPKKKPGRKPKKAVEGDAK